MKRLVVACVAAVAMTASTASANVIELSELGFNVDGTVRDHLGPPVTPFSFSGFDDSAFDYGTGLGTLILRIVGGGAHTVTAFFDHDLYDDGPNSTNSYFDDSGAALGAKPAGARWEIDEPGFGVSYVGDIFLNFDGGTLDETVFDGVITEEDVAMAWSWNFTLAPNEEAFITFNTSTTDPGGFRLRQFDAADELFLSSSMRVGQRQVPEPAMLTLVGAAAIAAALRRRKQ